jgi:uncharacterized protein
MRVVLDTNVLLSALISPHGAQDTIYRAWRAARFEVVTSRVQLDELRRASRYPEFKAVLQPNRVGTMINNLQRAIVLDRLSLTVEADDPDDAFLVAIAIAGDADYLVTGDRRAGLLQKKRQSGSNANSYPCLFLSGSAVTYHPPDNSGDASWKIWIGGKAPTWSCSSPACPTSTSSAASRMPVAPAYAYQVSGEYATLKAAVKNGWPDECACVLEALLGFKRAGADEVLIYFARDAARWLKIDAP